MSGKRGVPWQEEQLEMFIAEHAEEVWIDHLCVNLGNPKEEREIDELMLQELLSCV